jgi:RNA polymerase sigma-70 factor (ECF subfamily)
MQNILIAARFAPDAALAQAIASGERGAFEVVVRRYEGLLLRTARAILHDDFDAEDVVQNAYLLAYRHIGSYRGTARLSTWLVRIVINEARACLRRRRRTRDVVSFDDESAGTSLEAAVQLANGTSDSPERAAMRSDLRSLLQARIAELPAAQRGVFTLRAVDDCSVAEIAVALGVPGATVRTRFFRARNRLGAALAPYLARPTLAPEPPTARAHSPDRVPARGRETVRAAPVVKPRPARVPPSQTFVAACAVCEEP